ncbi:MAG: aconitate hydratase AcnA, partial [Propionibacteriales bacterium]|nr:aconitate hydratase AcnA [Propionibacteriales bacterium]
MRADSFGARNTLQLDGRPIEIFRLDAVGRDVTELPYSLRILLENLLRNENGETITAENVRAVAEWEPSTAGDRETLFTPARVLLQDFTGIPAIVDFAAMRDAMAELGGDPSLVNPQLPADLVIDHSLIADVTGVAGAYSCNAAIEFDRNVERYRFLRWGQEAFDGFRVVPPSTGIVHQVNLEYLAQVVFCDGERAFPDTLVGLDSHTTMINGLGVLGWGVGGIEAEAALLGQPYSMVLPQVVGMKLVGELPEGTTATDLVLTITELLRAHGVVGKFVEFFGPGVGQVPVANRATIGNMSPEYGSTCAIFPIDNETLRYLEFTGRSPEQVALVEAYAKEQGLFHDPGVEPRYSEQLELDLSSVEPSLAGPSRPQDRVSLSQAKPAFRAALQRFTQADPAESAGVEVTAADGERFELDHGAVAIAAITSCTNTSNPQVMLAAGLLAKNAVERGLATKPWVKSSLAPGSKVVVDYYERAGLLPYLEKLRFNLVGFGCTTCVGNSGPLAPEISEAIRQHELSVCAVLSGNRNFEGRINPDVKMNYLASPPLVVAYAIAGTVDFDLYREPLGEDPTGEPVFLADIWPSSAQIEATIRDAVQSEMFQRRYADVFVGDERWQSLDAASADESPWDPDSTYVQKAPYFA